MGKKSEKSPKQEKKKLENFFFPKQGVTIKASSIEEAIKILQKRIPKDQEIGEVGQDFA